ncbi:HEAT repeat domain-containing protein [Clostridium sp. JNZ J1-5]
MKKGLVEFNWNEIDKYNEEDITYFLFIEGKSIETICRIRNIDRPTVQNHIIQGKIKYRFLTKSKNTEDLFKEITKAGKRDKIEVLNSLDEENKRKVLEFIKNGYTDMYSRDKEVAVWIIGELKDFNSLDILAKASVHKFVNIRRMAVSAMGKIESPKCETALIRALEDSNPQVVTYAIKALQKLNSKRAVEKIIYLKNTSDKEYIKRAAEIYLDNIEEDINNHNVEQGLI